MQVGAVHLFVIGAVGGLGGQIVHAVEHVLDFLHSALGGLHQGDAVLHVLLGGLQAGDLGPHLLGNGKTRGVVAGTVDLVAGAELLQVLAEGGGVVVVVAVGVHRHDVVLNTHMINSFFMIRTTPFVRSVGCWGTFRAAPAGHGPSAPAPLPPRPWGDGRAASLEPLHDTYRLFFGKIKWFSKFFSVCSGRFALSGFREY